MYNLWLHHVRKSDHGIITGLINPSSLSLSDGSDEQIEKAKECMKPVAEPYFEKNKEKEDSICFLYTTGDELAGRLMGFLSISKAFPKLFIVDIPSGKKYISEDEKIDVEDFVKKFQEGSLTSKGLQD